MSRKSKRSADISQAERFCKHSPENAIASDGGGVTSKGVCLLVIAVLVIAAGYFSLSKADAAGRDLWSNMAALLLVGGYLLIPFAIIAGNNGPGENSPL